jgi:hypothetical protein
MSPAAAAAAPDGRIQRYDDFVRVHAYLHPASLHERLYRKLADEVFDGGEVFAVDPCEGGRQRRLVLAGEAPLKRESDVFLVDHAWSFRLSDALKHVSDPVYVYLSWLEWVGLICSVWFAILTINVLWFHSQRYERFEYCHGSILFTHSIPLKLFMI